MDDNTAVLVLVSILVGAVVLIIAFAMIATMWEGRHKVKASQREADLLAILQRVKIANDILPQLPGDIERDINAALHVKNRKEIA